MKIKNWEAILWDCLEVMKRWTENKIDFIFSDLPYSDEKIKRVTANSWDVWIDLEKLFIEFNRVLKKNWVICMTATNPFSSVLIYKSIELQEKYKWDLKYKYEWIWEKDHFSNFANVNHQPWRIHEHILVFWKSATTYAWKNWEYMNYNPQKTIGKPYAMMSGKWTKNLAYSKESLSIWTENLWDRHPTTILKFKKDKDKLHPTQKPVELIKYLLNTYTNEWDLCLDPTSWSWTLWVACENTNRKWICIEKDETYFNIWCERITNLSS